MGLVENVENEGGSPGFGNALFTTSAVGAPAETSGIPEDLVETMPGPKQAAKSGLEGLKQEYDLPTPTQPAGESHHGTVLKNPTWARTNNP